MNHQIHKFLSRVKTLNRELFFRVLKHKIKNENFSILCNCCIAGTFYHNLKMPFLSPTINLSIDNHSFIKFVKNLNYYLSQELVEICDDTFKCPVGSIGDIKIVFTHYKSFSEAYNAWNRRKTRINYSNIYIVMRDLAYNDITCEEAVDLAKYCKNLVIFKKSKSKCKYFKKLTVKGDEHEYSADRFGFRHWEKEFNWAKFLNKNRK